MQKIKNSFVSFEIAKLLEEIGFIEECFGYYSIQHDDSYFLCVYMHEDTSIECGNFLNSIEAPTWSQVIDWFRNEKKLEINVFKWVVHCYHKEDNPNGECEVLALPHYIYDIERAFEYTDDWEYQSLDDELKFHTYEEARISAILKAIEIVKNKK